MSATNRGAKRRDQDFYVTPEAPIRALLKRITLKNRHNMRPGTKILEPCAGNGAIINVIRDTYGEQCHITAVEIREEERTPLWHSANWVVIGDILEPETWVDLAHDYDVIISNPPYSKAQAIIERLMQEKHSATDVIMLLRLGFLCSDKRKEFWRRYPVCQVYPLSARPSFTGKGTDATDYAWFVWSNWRKPEICPI